MSHDATAKKIKIKLNIYIMMVVIYLCLIIMLLSAGELFEDRFFICFGSQSATIHVTFYEPILTPCKWCIDHLHTSYEFVTNYDHINYGLYTAHAVYVFSNILPQFSSVPKPMQANS